MRQISTNNGGGSLGPALSALSPSVVRTVLVLAVAALIVALLLLRAWMRRGCAREHAVARYLFAYGAGLAGLALLQAAVLPFGAGSAYAVQKYAYGLITFLVLGLAALAGLHAERYGGTGRRVPAERWRSIASVSALAAFCASLLLVEGAKLLDVSDLVGLEQRIRVLRDTVLPVPTPERSNAVLLGRRIPQSVEYMFTIGILKAPRAKLADMIGYDRLGDAAQLAVSSPAARRSRISMPTVRTYPGRPTRRGRCQLRALGEPAAPPACWRAVIAYTPARAAASAWQLLETGEHDERVPATRRAAGPHRPR